MFLQFIKNLAVGGPSGALAEAVSQNPVLLDVRSEAEFASGSVAGAVNIPLQNLEQKLGKLEKARPIVVFCRSGSRSAMAKALLEKNGFGPVANGGPWQNVNQLINH